MGADIVAEVLTSEQEFGDHVFADLVADSPYGTDLSVSFTIPLLSGLFVCLLYMLPEYLT